MNRQERKDAIYMASFLRQGILMHFGGKMETDAGNEAISNAVAAMDVALKELGKGVHPTDKRAIENQVQYKTLRVVTRAAHPYPDGDQVVISVQDLNTLFRCGREECVLCEKTEKQAKRCEVRRLLRKNSLWGVCDRDE